jgi:hypothetical protein
VNNSTWDTVQIYTGLIARAGQVSRWSQGGNETVREFVTVSFGRIKDGSAYTVLLMEKSADAQNYSAVVSGPEWGMIGNTGGMLAPGWHTNGRFIRPLVADNEPRSTTPATPDGARTSNEQGFGSPHPGTTTAVLGDGSTHSVSNNISWDILSDICMRDDGYQVDHSSF